MLNILNFKMIALLLSELFFILISEISEIGRLNHLEELREKEAHYECQDGRWITEAKEAIETDNNLIQKMKFCEKAWGDFYEDDYEFEIINETEERIFYHLVGSLWRYEESLFIIFDKAKKTNTFIYQKDQITEIKLFNDNYLILNDRNSMWADKETVAIDLRKNNKFEMYIWNTAGSYDNDGWEHVSDDECREAKVCKFSRIIQITDRNGDVVKETLQNTENLASLSIQDIIDNLKNIDTNEVYFHLDEGRYVFNVKTEELEEI